MSDEEVAGYGRDPDAGFGALRTERGLLPLVSMQVDARVAGVVATVELTQQFVNTTGEPIEATYVFPLPDRAAVHRFRMEVAGRVVDGVVDERGAARAQYDQAIAAGRRATIAEEERPGVFTLRVGNLLPGEIATVRLSLVGPLPVDDGEVTFRFPLVVAPRYIPGSALGGEQAGLGLAADTDRVPDASRISPPVLLPGSSSPVRLGLRVTMEGGVAHDVASSLHAVTDVRGEIQVVEVRPGERLDRDFLLRWRVDQAELVSSLVCADDPDGAGGTLALTIVSPSTQSVGARARDVVILVDRSGSMRGWKMVAARRAAARMVDTLTSRDRFCVLAFDHVVEALFPEAGLCSATDHHRARAVSALGWLEARGGTELAEPLVQALAMLQDPGEGERCVVLVTDGQVGNESEVLRRIAPSLGDVRVFTLGIDQAVNAGFLRQLASVGGGLCELVESEARLEQVMDKVHRRIGAPVVTGLALRAVGLEVDLATLAPGRLPDVYAGAPVVILGRYRGAAPADAAVEVSGESLGEPWRQAVTLRRPAQVSTWLAASWARAHLRDLEDRYASGARGAGLLEPHIVQISKRFGVLSRFTAYLAVDQGAVVNLGGPPRRVVQPVESPAGWGAQATRREAALPSLEGLLGGPTLSAREPTLSVGEAPEYKTLFSGGPTLSVPSSARYGLCGEGADDEREGALRSQASYSMPRRASASSLPPRHSITQKSIATQSSPRPVSGRLGAGAGVDGSTPAAATPAAATPAAAYVRRLATLATDLRTLAVAGGDLSAVRRVRQRLAQWVEDVRSVGGRADLAAAVEALVRRMSGVLSAPGGSPAPAELRVIADELAQLATGAAPVGAAPVASPVATATPRPPFWK